MAQNRPPPANNGKPPAGAPDPARRNPAPPAGSRPPTPARPAGSPARTGRVGPPPARPTPRPAGAGSGPVAPRPSARPTPGTTSRPAGAARRAAPGRAAPGVSGALTNALDRAGLQRFSTGRYLAIWVPLLIVILIVILFLIYVGQSAPTPLPKYMIVETVKGTFKIALYTDPADKVQDVVRNFTKKAQSGAFNGRVFHRVEDWVVQGGDPNGNGSGGGKIPAQYNTRPFKRGAVGVASTAGGGQQINDSQWFVVKKDADYLNGQYSNFGQVVDGMDVVDKIAIGDVMTKVTVADTLTTTIGTPAIPATTTTP